MVNVKLSQTDPLTQRIMRHGSIPESGPGETGMYMTRVLDLYLTLLNEAARDLVIGDIRYYRLYRFGSKFIRRDAYRWFMDGNEGEITFTMIAKVLDIDVDKAREEIDRYMADNGLFDKKAA